MGESIFIKELAKKMVLLSGKNQSDIKIEYTGLRKGEKLNEKLFSKKREFFKLMLTGFSTLIANFTMTKEMIIKGLLNIQRKIMKKNQWNISKNFYQNT